MITLSKEQATALASFASVAEAPKVGTAISFVLVRFTPKTDTKANLITVTATDRYVMATGEFMPHWVSDDQEETDFLVSPDSLKFLKSAKAKVFITVGEAEIIFESNGAQLRQQVMALDRFPSVQIDNLLDTYTEATAQPTNSDVINLDLETLAKVSKLRLPMDSKTVFKFSFQGLSETGKPRPVLLTRENLKVLVQPHNTLN